MSISVKKSIALFVSIIILIMPVRADYVGAAWPLGAISGSERYDGEGVRIALIDTGVSCKYLDSSHVLDGKNYVFPEQDENDLNGHGTGIASIILGSSKLGIKGAAPGAVIIPLVYISQYSTGVPVNGGVDAISAAVHDAVDIYHCRIINISSGITNDNPKLRKAVAYAEKNDALIISSVGNSNISSPTDVYYPAQYDTVIGVGAADRSGGVAEFSQRNSSVKILAPGVDVPTAPKDNSDEILSVNGSSYAAAFVAGAAAVLIQRSPDLTAAQLRNILYDSADGLSPKGCDIVTGWGVLDIKKALTEAVDYMPFTDVTPKSWYYDAVLSDYRAGLFTGIGDNSFLPDGILSRAMFVSLLYRLDKNPKPAGASVYNDVSAGSWYYDAVIWASGCGIMKGSDGDFNPQEAITREDLAQALYRYAEYKGLSVGASAAYDLTTFDDFYSVSDCTISAIRWACSAYIMTGVSESKLEPRGNATRAQAAVILSRFMGLAAG